MTDSSTPEAATLAPPLPAAGPLPAAKRRYDRSIVEGPLRPAVWKIAWPSMLTNVIGGLQGIVDHVLVGNLVGFTANAAIGVAWQIIIFVGGILPALLAVTGILMWLRMRSRRRRHRRMHAGATEIPAFAE